MKFIAHRGASAHAPENTLAALRLAVEQGADGVEVDVRVTRNNKLAVLHDPDTRRVAPGQPIHTANRQRLAVLKTLDVGSWKDAKYAGERIPELSEALGVLGESAEIFVELKSRESDAILAELDKVLQPTVETGFPAARVVIMSFDEVTLRKIKKVRPMWRALLLLNKKPSTHVFGKILSTIRAKHLDGIGQNRTWALTDEQYAKLRESAAILSVWTVDSPAEVATWKKRGFDYLTSNDVTKMKSKRGG
ncbi:MAG TPA: glycerophosphodiester phosphodiesterase family protein [Opitutales bacterium]|nr:glycerophosphodiester phosphodiesterase family protein [Opitutales bacterium]